MAYKIQKGQVEGLREALLELAEDISQTGVDLATSINDVISSLTTLINSTGNYLDNKIDDVDNTLTANLELTGLSVQNQINLLPDQTDYNNLDSRLDDHDTKIDLMSGKISHLSGVVSGLKDFEESVALGEFDVMPLTGSGDLVVANGFKHRVNEEFYISGEDLLLCGQNIIIESSFEDIQILPEDDLLISGNSMTEIRAGESGYIRFSNNGDGTMAIAGNSVNDLTIDGIGFTVNRSTIEHVLEDGVEDGYVNFSLGRAGHFAAQFSVGGTDGIYLDRNECTIKTSGSMTLETKSPFSEINLESEFGVNLTTASGDIEITANNGFGGGSVGVINLYATKYIKLQGLPTSDPGVSTALWKSGKYLMIS